MFDEKYDFTEVPGLTEIFAEFSERAKKEKPIWFAKLATINLSYKGKGYIIKADDLDVTDEQFECVQHEMTERIKELDGVTSAWYDGFLD